MRHHFGGKETGAFLNRVVHDFRPEFNDKADSRMSLLNALINDKHEVST